MFLDFYRCKGKSPLRRRPKGFAVALWKPSHCTPMFLDFYRCKGKSPLRRRPKGFAVALWKPSHCTPMFLDFYAARGNRLCGGDKGAVKTNEVCDRPLDPFGSPLPKLTFSAAGGIAPLGAIEGCTHRFGSSVRISLIDMQYGSASWLRPCSRITCAVFCIAGKALRIRWLAWMTMFTPCTASSSSVVML